MFETTDWDDDLSGIKLNNLLFKYSPVKKSKKDKAPPKNVSKPKVSVNNAADNQDKNNTNSLSRKQRRNKNKNKKRTKNKYKVTEATTENTTNNNNIALEQSNSDERSDTQIVNSLTSDKESKRNLKRKISQTILQSEDITNETNKKPSLTDQAVTKLKGARFRYLNEQLYTRTSEEAINLFKSDKSAFSAYHDGFSTQVATWPLNPVNLMVSYIKSRSKELVVGDFGCGDAVLATKVKNKVHSFDLVASNDRVTVCDIANVPLENESIDIVVFCLSLMGTNMLDFIREANRVLKKGGVVKIAEIASRFSNINEFVKAITKLGFTLLKKDTRNEYFFMFDFKKLKNSPKTKVESSQKPLLKPCVYKKR